jgi:hypothetical protein
MKELTNALFLGILLTSVCLPAGAQQGYQQNYGGSRVTYQNQTGLYHNDPSYISAGTLGQSARGKAAGINTGGLPTTSWGNYIRNPGDDIYTGNNGAMRQDNGSMVYADEIARANYARRMQSQRQQMLMEYRQRQNQVRVQQGNFYVPGSNGGAASYGSGVAATYSSGSSSGTASTYGSYQKTTK